MASARGWLLIVGLELAAAAVMAQTPRTYTLRVDNDAFDFWMAPYNRPDEEYTSGVRLGVTGGDAPWWSRRFMSAVPCTTKTTECRDGGLEIGQDIYSPATSVEDPIPAPGSRPNAGWLYLTQTARLLNDRSADAFSITLGVTGPPSLARQTQSIAHDVAPAFNRPTDWDRQIPFEAGAVVRAERRERFVLSAGAFGVDVIPRVGAALGNVTTDAEGGLDLRAGWHLAHPWLPSDGPIEIAVVAGGTGRLIARDLFLDGRAPLDTTHITHRPFVASPELGLEFRYRWISLGYRVVDDSRSYAHAPRWHPWSSLTGSVTVDR